MADDFLARLAVLASTEPCVVPRDDLLRLLTVAGLFDTHVYHAVAGSPEDPGGAELCWKLGDAVIRRRSVLAY